MKFLAQVAAALQDSIDQSIDGPLDWRLETHWTWAPWFTVLFVVAVVLGIGYLYSRESSPAGTGYRTLLAVLRLTSIALVLVMLSELLLSAARTGLPRLVVLVDHSASMDLEQPPMTSDAPSKASAQTRLDSACELFLSNNAEWLERCSQKYRVEFYGVADGLQPLGSSVADLTASLGSLSTEGPGAQESRLGDALAEAIDTRSSTLPAAIVLATDGRTTAGRSLDEARDIARRRGTPVYAVGYGATTAEPDLRLTNLLAESVVFVDDMAAVGVTLEATSAKGLSAMVRLRDLSTDKVVDEQRVDISRADFSSVVQLVARPDSQGERTYRVEVEPLDGERDQQNNLLEHTITVSKEQLRVLLAAGYPNYEFRYLKNLLDRDSAFELTSYLQEADDDYASQDATAVSRLPMRDGDLNEFAVLVLIDLDPRLLPPSWWQLVERHIVEQGGGLVLVAGPRYFPWQYAQTPSIATLAPVDLKALGRAGGVYDKGYTVEPTTLGAEAAFMQLGASTQESSQVWRGLPPLYWYASAEKLKPAATVLATYPTSQGPAAPLIAMQYVGAGRVLYHGIDSTWRWRFRVGDVFFARYWGQSLRQLARSKMLNDGTSPTIVVEQQLYELGKPVRVTLRGGSQQSFVGSDGPRLLLTAKDQPRRRIPLSANRFLPGQLQATIDNLAPGSYRLSGTSADFEKPPASVEFTVLAPPDELADATMNRAELERLAEGTYGKFYTASTANQLIADLPTAQREPLELLPPVELWNRWWMLAAITGCLSAEWILRKRRAML